HPACPSLVLTSLRGAAPVAASPPGTEPPGRSRHLRSIFAVGRIFVGRLPAMAGISAHGDHRPAAVDSRETGVTADASCLAPATIVDSYLRSAGSGAQT